MTRTVSTYTLALLSCLASSCTNAWAEYYPKRPLYDYRIYKPTNRVCATTRGNESQVCGPVSEPVFDSFRHAPLYGDEPPFFDGRHIGEGGRGHDPVQNVARGDHEIELRIYVANDANPYFGRRQIAKNTYVLVTLPTGTSDSLRCRAQISASNAATVEDTVDLTDGRPFSLKYIPGTARLVSVTTGETAELSDDVISHGTLVTNTGVEGLFAPGVNRAMFVEFRVRVQPASASKAWLFVATGASALLLLLLVPTFRKRVRHALAAILKWNRDRAIHEAVLANLLAGLVIIGIGWLVARLL